VPGASLELVIQRRVFQGPVDKPNSGRQILDGRVSKLYLATEFVVLYVGLPCTMLFRLIPRVPLALVAVACITCALALSLDPDFNKLFLWNVEGALVHLPSAVFTFVVVGLVFTAVVAWLLPEQLFALPRKAPVRWAIFMVLYPILSVYPQELIYRSFLFHRYGSLFATDTARIVASALAFAFGHVFFRAPWVAMSLTFIGGLLFSYRYTVSHSLLLASIDHALFGQLMFTVGLHKFFFSRASP
jgi:membrane protease YdiL (CAAX protease family)